MKQYLNNYHIQRFGMGFVLLLVIFVPRLTSLEAAWSHDEDHWITGSWQFLDAIRHRDWMRTYQLYHPGVTTMWCGAIGLWVNGFAEKLSHPLTIETLKATRIPVALMVSAGLFLAYLLLTKIYRHSFAWLATLFIAFNPFYLAYSRITNTDALLTTFILLYLLSMLIYLKQKNKKYLIFSGIFAGLSFLTKTSALLILPYSIAILALSSRVIAREERHQKNDGQEIGVCREVIGWLSAGILTIFLVWPATWALAFRIKNWSIPYVPLISPAIAFGLWWALGQKTIHKRISLTKLFNWKIITAIILSMIIVSLLLGIPQDIYYIYKLTHSNLAYHQILEQIQTKAPWLYKIVTSMPEPIRAIVEATFTPHSTTHLFMGKLDADPGIFFYPGTILLRISLVVLLLLGIGLCFLILNLRNRKVPEVTTLALLGFAVFYTIPLSFVAKKLDRFVLPIYPCLDIIAAAVLWRLGKNTSKFIGRTSNLNQYEKVATWLTVLVLLATQGIFALSLHPYYFAWHSHVFGKGSKMIHRMFFGIGEGLDKAAQYLDQKPNAKNLKVALSDRNKIPFKPYFQGKIVSHGDLLTADYIIIYLHDIIFRRDSEVVQHYYLQAQPEHIVQIHGVPYVWIYQRLFDFTYQPVQIAQQSALKLQVKLKNKDSINDHAEVVLKTNSNWKVESFVERERKRQSITTQQLETSIPKQNSVFYLIQRRQQVPDEISAKTSVRYADGRYISEDQVIRFYQCHLAPQSMRIDGNMDDWEGIEAISLANSTFIVGNAGWWRGVDDLSGNIYVVCSTDDLYIAINVLNDSPSQSDFIALLLASDREGKIGRRWYEIFLKPNAHVHPISPQVSGYFRYIDQKNTSHEEKIVVKPLEVKGKRHNGGYFIEIQIPMSYISKLGVQSGCHFDVYIHDGEKRKPIVRTIMMTWSTRAVDSNKTNAICLLAFPELSK